MKISLSIVIIFSFWGCMQSSIAASFNCQHAESQTEHAICEHRVLNDADVKMATSYTILRRLIPMGSRSVVQTEQVKWLGLRNQCQDNVECLQNVYRMRQQKLDLYLDQIYRQGPF